MLTEFLLLSLFQTESTANQEYYLKLYQTKSVSRISTTITERMDVWYDKVRTLTS